MFRRHRIALSHCHGHCSLRDGNPFLMWVNHTESLCCLTFAFSLWFLFSFWCFGDVYSQTSFDIRWVLLHFTFSHFSHSQWFPLSTSSHSRSDLSLSLSLSLFLSLRLSLFSSCVYLLVQHHWDAFLSFCVIVCVSFLFVCVSLWAVEKSFVSSRMLTVTAVCLMSEIAIWWDSLYFCLFFYSFSLIVDACDSYSQAEENIRVTAIKWISLTVPLLYLGYLSLLSLSWQYGFLTSSPFASQCAVNSQFFSMRLLGVTCLRTRSHPVILVILLSFAGDTTVSTGRERERKRKGEKEREKEIRNIFETEFTFRNSCDRPCSSPSLRFLCFSSRHFFSIGLPLSCSLLTWAITFTIAHFFSLPSFSHTFHFTACFGKKWFSHNIYVKRIKGNQFVWFMWTLYETHFHLTILTRIITSSFPQLRVPVQEERMGLDEAKHGGHAYPEHSLIMRTLATRLLAKDKANE